MDYVGVIETAMEMRNPWAGAGHIGSTLSILQSIVFQLKESDAEHLQDLKRAAISCYDRAKAAREIQPRVRRCSKS